MADWARLQQRLARSGEGLTDVYADLNGQPVWGIYEAQPADALGYGAGYQPQFRSADALREGAILTFYRADQQPLLRAEVLRCEVDGAGWRHLLRVE
ncbi:hypothetical protein [Parachitinimonas caeni]|uniref:Uncharacterized protein n=1 Tax=Parachitinimonas caeni TaxID=3031301 RepID=A0ABT7DZT7_9NEIS|nr:hypothetical protein [Parachitinimonas caeni]MDK2124152.1 hypothetical protein [Parachitinimonas caeni]